MVDIIFTTRKSQVDRKTEKPKVDEPISVFRKTEKPKNLSESESESESIFSPKPTASVDDEFHLNENLPPRYRGTTTYEWEE